ncbi:MAG: hypothetical protein JNL72_02335 [Flavipsychrobacter sp.]|nr:hypothetical protein [Flavipsychrobacter sp.]
MEIDFKEKMAGKSDEDLLNILGNMNKYVPEAIVAAKAELESRGHMFSDEEQEQVNADMVNKIELKAQEHGQLYNSSGNGDLVDWDVPEYYTKGAVWAFSFFIGTWFGAILLAINLYQKNRTAAVVSVVYGLVATILIVLVPDLFWQMSSVLHAIAGLGLIYMIWPRYIDADARFRARSVWPPIIVAVALLVVFFFVIFGMRAFL